jgi:regulatory protein
MELTSAQQDWLKARRERAFRLLAAREHSRRELRDKLLKPARTEQALTDKEAIIDSELASTLVDSLLEQLITDGLQSDARFLDSLVRQYLSKGKGPLALQQACRIQQLDTELVQQQLQRLETVWPKQVQRVREKRFGNEPPADSREAARMQRFLAQRGFTPELIRKAVFQH